MAGACAPRGVIRVCCGRMPCIPGGIMPPAKTRIAGVASASTADGRGACRGVITNGPCASIAIPRTRHTRHTRRHHPGRHHPGRHHPGRHHPGRRHPGRHHAGWHHAGRWHAGWHHAGRRHAAPRHAGWMHAWPPARWRGHARLPAGHGLLLALTTPVARASFLHASGLRVPKGAHTQHDAVCSGGAPPVLDSSRHAFWVLSAVAAGHIAAANEKTQARAPGLARQGQPLCCGCDRRTTHCFFHGICPPFQRNLSPF